MALCAVSQHYNTAETLAESKMPIWRQTKGWHKREVAFDARCKCSKWLLCPVDYATSLAETRKPTGARIRRWSNHSWANVERLLDYHKLPPTGTLRRSETVARSRCVTSSRDEDDSMPVRAPSTSAYLSPRLKHRLRTYGESCVFSHHVSSWTSRRQH